MNNQLEMFSQAMISFLGDEFFQKNGNEFDVNRCESWADVAAEIVLNSSFLTRYPEVKAILDSLSPTVSRNALDDPEGFVLNQIERDRQANLRKQLFDLQRTIVQKSSELVELEIKALELRRKVGGLNSV